MKNEVIIVGAGMSGLIAANMLRHKNPLIIEAQSTLPNNHSALLRFRSNVVAEATGIKFKKVHVKKAVYFEDKLHDKADLRMQNMYSKKVTGGIYSRSLNNLNDCERYISPENLIELLAKNVNISFNKEFSSSHIDYFKKTEIPVISTIPMERLLDLLGYNPNKKIKFNHKEIYTFTCKLNTEIDVYQTIYYPATDDNVYRASITGNLLTIEFTKHENAIEKEIFDTDNYREEVEGLLDRCLGIVCDIYDAKVSYQKYGKILPIDDTFRKQFIVEMSDRFGIYSLGRFATWRQLLLDDIVNDVKVIDSFIEGRNSYQKRLINSK
jgi:hypothetical protein